MPKKSVYQMLGELSHILNNKEMVGWAEKFDSGGHGAKAAATHIRKNLSAVAKESKALRAEIHARKATLKK